MLAVTLLTVGVATNVKAEEENLEQNSNANFEQVDGNKELYDEDGQPIYVYPFKEGDEEIKVWLPYGSSVKLYRKSLNEDKLNPSLKKHQNNAKSDSQSSLGELVELEYGCYEVKEIDYEKGGYQQPKPRFRDGYTSYYGMNQEFTIPLYEPLNVEQKKKIQKIKDDLTQGIGQQRCPDKQNRKKIPVTRDETLTFVFGSNGFYNGTKTYQYPKKTDNEKLDQELPAIPEKTGGQSANPLTKNDNLSGTSPEGNNVPSNENSQTNENTQQPTGKNNAENKTWTQRAKERINKAWERFKYYINPKNWFNRWRS